MTDQEPARVGSGTVAAAEKFPLTDEAKLARLLLEIVIAGVTFENEREIALGTCNWPLESTLELKLTESPGVLADNTRPLPDPNTRSEKSPLK